MSFARAWAGGGGGSGSAGPLPVATRAAPLLAGRLHGASPVPAEAEPPIALPLANNIHRFCAFLAEVEALPPDSGTYDAWSYELRAWEKNKPKHNRASLVAGLQPGVTEASFHLGGCSKQEFTLLCKALQVQGPLVRSVAVEHSED